MSGAPAGDARWRCASVDDGYVVGMVGDGNDAPAGRRADIDWSNRVAVETADVALANDDLHRLLDVVTWASGQWM